MINDEQQYNSNQEKLLRNVTNQYCISQEMDEDSFPEVRKTYEIKLDMTIKIKEKILQMSCYIQLKWI